MFRLLGLLLGGGRHYRGHRRHGSFFHALKGRLVVAIIMLVFGYFTYIKSSKKVKNDITGEVQRIGMSVKDEIALGLHASPRMERQHGGIVPDNNQLAQLVKKVGYDLVKENNLSQLCKYQFEFNLLKDDRVVNAFALPGGKTYITYALLKRFDKNHIKDQLAGVMGHEIGHVIARHSAEQATKSKLNNAIAGAVGTLTSDGYSRGGGQLAALTNKVLNTKYGRSDELESDKLGIVFMYKAGYDPSQMIRVMEILHSSSGGSGPPEFLSTHPSSKSRINKIKYLLNNIKKFKRSDDLLYILENI